MDHVLDPCKVGVAGGRHAEFPALVFSETVSAPIGDVEWWIGHNEVGLEIGVAVVVEGIPVGYLPFDPRGLQGSSWQVARWV